MKAGEKLLPISFVCPAQLKQGIEEIAASEGISTSDVVRRAVMSDLRRRKQETVDAAV
jgi:Arc/MetJ-type ribon-helix-helix transcriptional regulator